VLFGGADVSSDRLPWTYVPTWAWLSLPPVLLAGAAIGAVAGLQREEMQERAVALLAAIAFPVVFVVATGATLYDGLRHLLFVVPPLAVLASAGWVGLIEAARDRPEGTGRPGGIGRPEGLRYTGPEGLRYIGLVAAAAVLVAGLVEPVGFQWRNHPNQIAYIQPLAGGTSAAFGRYDLDYWGNCMLQSMARLPRQEGASLAITGWPLVVLQMDAGRFPGIAVVAEAEPLEPQLQLRPTYQRPAYSIELVRGTSDHVHDLASRDDIIDRVTTADGATLCVTRRASEALPATIFP
jgi:hypothetical protein